MNILVLGSGGREHAITHKIVQSPLANAVFVAPGNAGTNNIAENVNIGVNDFAELAAFVKEKEIQIVVVGPEDPLVNGIHDYFLADSDLANVMVIGPQKEAAQLEGSKAFAKAFMQRHYIPTAAYQSFTKETLQDAYQFMETLKSPYVLKADGLAAGKGVLIIKDLEEAKAALATMLVDEKFGKASQTVVIEEFLDGIELSCFVVTDGKDYKILPTAKDYKRIGEGDTGLNTGGMGAISPVLFADSAFMEKIESQIVKPTVEGLQKDCLPYIGFIFIGLIKVDGQPKVIEYNVRMGDPETEAVFPRIESDVVELFRAMGSGSLEGYQLEINEQTAAALVAVSGGYPEAYEKGKEISGLSEIEGATVFHAGTKMDNGKVLTNGGRVLALTTMDNNMGKALEKAYGQLSKITFDGINYRSDIGFDL
ncbi:MAG: phosphoribosylamine--glycine ligase [Bacteroidota bacterium]